ncbi:hypothetical protein [Streptomyces phaeochromogenes]|uniref:hypothetical protein n=1 Tax=Streptomyces phaeochromogenes TaxID=1923 RepID=UPI002E0D3F5C|nr:hypothetical protein OG437_50815 [Streptomyces phaeochromogenes]
MWSADDVVRASVRRQGEGLSVAQVADKGAEAERRERETRQQLNSPAVDRGPYDVDPEDLAEQWVARHAEWRRVAALMDGQGWSVYSTEQDVQGSTWARERDEQREGALARRAAWQRERQDARDELRAQVWLSADVSRRLRAITARTGLEPEQVLAQLADRVRIDDDGALTVDAFTPH